MSWIVSKKKAFHRPTLAPGSDTARPDRKDLVGLLPVDGTSFLPEGAQLVLESDGAIPSKDGRSRTSSYRSATLGERLPRHASKRTRATWQALSTHR